MDKRVLITGIRGFAGQYIAPYLARCGYEVFGTVNSQDSGADSVFQADLRELIQIARVVEEVRPTHVVHLAAISSVTHGDVREIYETNVVGSRNLLQALSDLEIKPQSVLMMSSANVYGNSLREVLSETDEFNPANDYGVSKAAMELMTRNFMDRLNIVVTRAFNYTGRGQSSHFLIPKIVSHFRARADFIELGNTDVARDFSDVRAVVVYLQRLLELPGAIGKTYNICSGVPYSLESIIEMCERISGHRIEVRTVPRLQRTNEVKLLAGNPEWLRADVGRVEDYSFEDTLAWMLSDPSDAI